MNALIAAWSLRSFRHGFAVGAGAMSADFLLMLFTLALYGVLKGLGQRFFAPFYAAGGVFFLWHGKAAAGGLRRGGASSEGLPSRPLAGARQPVPNGVVAHGGAQLHCPLRRRVGGWALSRHLDLDHRLPRRSRVGWRLNSRLTWLAIKFFSAAVLVVFGALFIYTAASLVLGEG
jgi:threonine/homoserine/homoserine lactone efflux protein